MSQDLEKTSATRRYRGFAIEQVIGPFRDDYHGAFRFGGWRTTCPKCGRTIGAVYQSDLRDSITAHHFDARRCLLLRGGI